MKQINFEELNQYEKKLFQKVKEILKTAYNPHSKFLVGSAIFSKKGQIVMVNNTNISKIIKLAIYD